MSAATHSAINDTLAGQFIAQARLTPERPAVRFCGTELSFADLNSWSDEIARRISSAGIASGCLMAVSVQRSPAILAALLGVLKVGAAYVALDPETPVRQRRLILSEANPHAILCTPDLYAALGCNIRWVDLPQISTSVEPFDCQAYVTDDALFHLVYTSGTTGKPKGVRVRHGSVRNRLEWMWRTYPFPPGSVMCIQKSCALVASPWEMFGGLLQGIPSVLLTREQVLDPDQLYSVVAGENITHMFLVPPLIESLVDQQEKQGREVALRLVTSGADVLPVDLVRRFHRAFQGVTLVNLYGMTECSSNVAAFDTGSLSPDAPRVPVGRPICGSTIRIVDDSDRILPIGVQGQIVIAGPAVADGYHGAPELTDRQFRRDANGSVWYQTGDYGRWLHSGDLELTGRLDNQVKIQGFRVEIEEVEAALQCIPGIKDVAVAPKAGSNGMSLIAFFTGDRVDISAMRPSLLASLPEYMVPRRFVRLACLPFNESGKLDRAKVSKLVENRENPEPMPTPLDLTPTERRVAKIWQELLGSPPLSAEADFFKSGGHSMLAVRFVSRLRTEFRKHVPLALIFQNATVRSLSAALKS